MGPAKGKTESRCLLTLDLHCFTFDSLQLKECSLSSFPPHEVFFFLVFSFEGTVEVGAKKLKKAGPKGCSDRVNLYLCVAEVSHETKTQGNVLV